MKNCENMSKTELMREIASLRKEKTAQAEQARQSIARLQQRIEELESGLQCRVSEEVERHLAKERLLLLAGHQAAMEELTGNITHQWRQPLNIIGLTVQKLQFDFERNEVDHDYMNDLVHDVLNTVKQMSRTVQNFRNFLLADELRQQFDLKETIHRVLLFVEDSMKSGNIAVRLDVCEEELPINGYRNECSRAILNILNKCRKVLLENRIEKPSITIDLSRQDGYSLVTIRGNGGCIPGQSIDRAFESCSTAATRATETDMELFALKTIIEQKMEGKMTASGKDGGVEFRIEL